MIHIGAVDAPVTIAEIDAAVDECAKLKQSTLHVLGYDHPEGSGRTRSRMWRLQERYVKRILR